MKVETHVWMCKQRSARERDASNLLDTTSHGITWPYRPSGDNIDRHLMQTAGLVYGRTYYGDVASYDLPLGNLPGINGVHTHTHTSRTVVASG